jgi:hypothetical protein
MTELKPTKASQGMFDRLEGSELEVWLKIVRKKPYGWQVGSVNMKNLKKIGFGDVEKGGWDIITINQPCLSHSVFAPLTETTYYLVLKAHKRQSSLE